jgi:putative FmdB family regulatory protein
MPIYEYTCRACGHEFEVLQKITDKPVRKCEACGKLKAQRHISQTSFVLKGTGWYTTDYAGRKAHGSSESESTSSSSSSSSTSTSSSAEPAKGETPAAKPAEKPAESKRPAKKAASA